VSEHDRDRWDEAVNEIDPERVERVRRPPPPELPPDPDLDDLPPELREGSLTLVGWDRDTGERFEGPVEPIDLARGLADRRRLREDEQA
jgi:hypothetical protein